MSDLDKLYKKRMALFKKLYFYDNATYDPQLGVSLYDDSVLSGEDKAFMNEIGWKANEPVLLEHDALIDSIAELGRDERLSEARLIGEFVAAVDGRYRRGVNGPISLRYIRRLPTHAYRRARKLVSCGVCGYYEHLLTDCSNLSQIRESLWIGHAWASPIGVYADLTERLELPEVMPTSEDAVALRRLLEAVDRAADDEKPGALEKRLSAEKVLRGNAGTRRALLSVLAGIGVLPNIGLPIEPDRWIDHEAIVEAGMELDTTQGRSDLEMPYAGWRGRLGVDWNRAKELFGAYL
ncbi:hypothetical protein [Saccharibacillus alkalitolerans]|uniref:Uncharacterized protein n=1 Tax=Saccharibacillus alkalitolerans TaxID=2705290 RepID=A0ABX0F9L4_9BACL|nr:hypothetical protein [Saccharibacillus alkalitolerans]NGZ77626.1 hypothetical protein [Saccharibacillus alkalitolerans]